jgi:outer membrane protein OmpA-like peptidoglycan-associated protein
MERRSRSRKSPAGITTAVLLAAVLVGCSTQPREWGRCAVIGGATGAVVGGGGAAGVAYATGPDNDRRSDEAKVGAMVGVLVGTAIGAIIGHYTCDPIIVAQKPSPPPPPPPAPTPAPVKEKLVLRGVHFDFNKAVIRPGDAAVLDEAAATLKAHPDVSVDVNGYCDAVGGEKYNQRLSERRAEAVLVYLVKAGVARNKLSPHGFGKTNFVATNDTDEGRAQNRRVELVPAQQE